MTGTVATQPPGGAPAENTVVVPAEATAVVLNATVVRPSTQGFLSIRPGDATGDPATSNINWAAGGANIANSVTVQLPASGQIDVFVNGTVGHVLIDVAGYTTDTRLDDLQAQIDGLQAQVDATEEGTPLAGGRLKADGTVLRSRFAPSGFWRSARVSEGRYALSFQGVSCPIFGRDVPGLFVFSASDAGHTVAQGDSDVICETGTLIVNVETRTSAGTLSDADFSFVAWR